MPTKNKNKMATNVLTKENTNFVCAVSAPEIKRSSSPLPLQLRPSNKYSKKKEVASIKLSSILSSSKLPPPSSKLFSSVTLDVNKGRPLHDVQHEGNRPSLLSHRSQVLNLRGFYNLFVIVLLVTNARMVLENILKYGWMIQIPRGVDDIVRNWPILFCFLKMHLCILHAWVIERYVAVWMAVRTNWILIFLQFLNFCILIIVPWLTVVHYQPQPAGAVLLLSFSIVWLFKFLSFHHVCYDIRKALMDGEELSDVCNDEKEAACARNYPKSILFRHFYSFIWMPTMCYQLQYPRTEGIRWLSVLRHIFESLVCMAVMKVILEQYIVIIVRNTFTVDEMKTTRLSVFIAHLVERMMKLSIPNLYVWLLMFVGLFHHWCNILAELTLFGDRLFYEDWWNASSFGEYWRKWNLPIHQFLNRHVNKPLLRSRVPKFFAGLVVFSISALLHEYIVVVPLQLGWTGYVFWAFMGQVPLMYLTNLKFFQVHKTIGNVFFWVVFCFTGQPLGILLYFYLWRVKAGEVQEVDVSKMEMSF